MKRANFDNKFPPLFTTPIDRPTEQSSQSQKAVSVTQNSEIHSVGLDCAFGATTRRE